MPHMSHSTPPVHPLVSNMSGWICPKCGRVLAPWVTECLCGPTTLWIQKPDAPIQPITLPAVQPVPTRRKKNPGRGHKPIQSPSQDAAEEFVRKEKAKEFAEQLAAAFNDREFDAAVVRRNIEKSRRAVAHRRHAAKRQPKPAPRYDAPQGWCVKRTAAEQDLAEAEAN